MTQERDRSRLLRLGLRINGTFSATTGLVALAGQDRLAPWLGLRAADLGSVGVELLAFSAFLFFLASRDALGSGWRRGAAIAVIAADALWVLGSGVALFADTPLTIAGRITVLAVAIVVADVAAVQLTGLLRLRRDTVAEPALQQA